MGILISNNVCKKYGNFTALDNISIDIPKGSIFGLLGPNGAGKTSFIRILNQITYPDSGEIILDGEKLKRKHIADIGYLPEERGLYKNMKVGEQILYMAQLKGMKKNEAQENMELWFKRLNIPDWRDKKIQELSKGMAQKIQFVVTVIHKPKILIFDELFSGLDPINVETIKEQVLYLRDQGATILFSTHRMESVEEMCDYIALINKSKKILDGKLIDVKRQFKPNSYNVGIIPKKDVDVESELSQRFDVEKADFKSIEEGELKINIHKRDNTSPNEILSFLMTKGEVTHFKEVIPTTNQIFMEAVKQNTK